MFTFGREHEKNCAANYIHDAADLPMIRQVIDAVHDLLEGSRTASEVRPIISESFTKGGSGVWEQTGNWLAKLGSTRPDLASLWAEFATHQSAQIRFRAAAFIGEMPDAVFQEVLPKLLADVSRKVRSKVTGDLWVAPRRNAEEHLTARLAAEADAGIRDQISLAIEAARGLGGS